MRQLLQDLRIAVRGIRKNPAFAAAAVASLAIGIGANTAIFSVADAVLLRRLPYPDPDRLEILWNRSPGLGITEDWFSTAQYFDILRGHSGFERLAIAIGANYNLTGDGGEPERIGGIRASSNLLPMLGAQPMLGRLFLPEDDRPGRAGTAVLSFGFWQRRFGGDPLVVGRRLRLNGDAYEVVGVLGSGFSLPREVMPTLGVAEEGEVFLPLPLAAAAADNRGHEDYNIVGRLRPGVTVAAAQAEMDRLTARLRRDHPDVYPQDGGLTFGIVPLHDQVAGGVRRPLLLLTGAVAFVLLIACANVGSLQLSRALARSHEIAVRAAIGASRGRIAAQLLTESALLAVAGGGAGALLAGAAVGWLHAAQPAGVPRLSDIRVNAAALVFTAVASAAAGLLSGLVPVIGAGASDLARALSRAGRGSEAGASGPRGRALRRALVAVEFALSVVLLAGAGLLIRSFLRLQDVDPGFDARGVLTFELMADAQKYPDGPSVQRAYRELWQRLDRLPGVTASGGVTSLPLSGFFAWGPITVEGRPMRAGERFINADQRVVGGRYFEVMRIPLHRGRLFAPEDMPDRPRVVIIDQRMADDLWPGQDPIGRRVRTGDVDSTAPWLTVVGVVGAVKQYSLDAGGRIAMYLPQTQYPARSLYVTIRSRSDPASLAAAVARETHALDPDLPLYRVQPMARWVEQSLARQRFAMALLGVFAAVAVVLATIGIYGVTSYLVAQGRREIGIRLALGATAPAVRRLVVREGLTVAAGGAAAGLASALALARAMRGLLFDIGPADPITFAAVAVGLLAVAFAGAYVPARRASRIDPLVALRAD